MLFWDVKKSEVDFEEHKDWFILRVMERGSLSDLRLLFKKYTRSEIKEALLTARYMSQRTLAFASCIVEENEEEFQCYKNRQSFQKHWKY